MGENNLELFDQFLEGTLLGEELSAFENRLQQDQEFKKEFDDYNLISSGIIYAGADDLKQKLVEREKKYTDSSSKSKNNFSLFYKIAAAVLVLVMSTFVIRNMFNQPDYEELYTTYYQSYPNVVKPINRSAEEQFQHYSQLYEKGDFRHAIAIINELRQNSNSDTLKFYLGQSYLAIDSTVLAADQFGVVDKVSVFHEAAQWYKVYVH